NTKGTLSCGDLLNEISISLAKLYEGYAVDVDLPTRLAQLRTNEHLDVKSALTFQLCSVAVALEELPEIHQLFKTSIQTKEALICGDLTDFSNIKLDYGKEFIINTLDFSSIVATEQFSQFEI